MIRFNGRRVLTLARRAVSVSHLCAQALGHPRGGVTGAAVVSAGARAAACCWRWEQLGMMKGSRPPVSPKTTTASSNGEARIIL